MPNDTGSSDETMPRGFSPRAALAFAGAFLAVGLYLPYFPVWLKTRDLADWQIGIMLSAPMFVRVATTPMIAAVADRAGDRANVLSLLAALTVAATAALALADSFHLLLLVVLVQAVFAAPHVLLIDAITLTGVRRYGVDYAQVRLWGSVAFIVSNVLGGAAIAAGGGAAVLPILICAYAATFAASLATPRVGRPRRPSPLSRIDVDKASRMLSRPDFVLRIAGGTLIHASHAMLYGFSAIFWSSLGISGSTIGLLWAVSVVGEVILFQFATRLIGDVAIGRIILVGGLIAMARWAVFPLDLGVGWYFLLQTLHAGSFAAVHLGLQRLIVSNVGEEREAAAQGLLFFFSGVTMGAATIASGFLFERFAGAAFLAMVLVAAAGLVCYRAGAHLARR